MIRRKALGVRFRRKRGGPEPLEILRCQSGTSRFLHPSAGPSNPGAVFLHSQKRASLRRGLRLGSQLSILSNSLKDGALALPRNVPGCSPSIRVGSIDNPRGPVSRSQTLRSRDIPGFADISLAGNNEAWTGLFAKICFLPVSEGKFGRVYFGFDVVNWPQGEMNENGLFFDAAIIEPLDSSAPSQTTRDFHFWLEQFRGELQQDED